MATLDDLLALFPDNTTGDIGADDIRTAVTALWGNDEGLEARVAALEASDPGTGFSVTGLWQVNPQVGATPQGGQVTADAASFASATVLRFARIDLLGQDAAASMLNASTLYMQQKSNSANYCTYEVAGTPSLAGTTITVPVTIAKANGSTGSVGWQEASVVVNVSTSVGG